MPWGHWVSQLSSIDDLTRFVQPQSVSHSDEVVELAHGYIVALEFGVVLGHFVEAHPLPFHLFLYLVWLEQGMPLE